MFSAFRKINPDTPANIEATSIENLASVLKIGSLKESNAIKIDIVNPIPASNPKPKTCFQLALDGKEAIPDFTANQEKRVTPNGLPTAKPNIMPNPNGLVRPFIISLSNRIFVLARANMGMIKKFTGLTIMCSMCSSGEALLTGLEGIVNANKTPAIVA